MPSANKQPILRDEDPSQLEDTRRPLIENQSSSSSIQYYDPELNASSHSMPFRGLVNRQLDQLLKLSWPVSTATLFRLMVFSTDTAFIGQLGTKQLAGASLGQVVLMVATVYIYGASSSLNTLGSQALGAGNPQLVGVWLQIALVMIAFLSIPALVIMSYAGQIVSLVEDDAEVLHFAKLFARYSLLAIPPLMWYSAVRQYFQSQGIVKPATVVSLLSLPLNLGYNQFFIHGIPGVFNGLGFVGGPIATATTACTQLLIYCVYMFAYRKAHVPTWPGWSWQHFTWARVKTFLGLSMPLGLALVCDESVFQSLVLMAGKFTDVDVDAMGVLFQVFGLIWALWWGLGLATQIIVGRALGKGDARAAKAAAVGGIGLVMLVMMLISGVCLLLSDYMSAPFSRDPAVADLVSRLVPFLQLSLWLYVVSATLGSILEGMAKVAVLSIASFCFAYGGTLPAAYGFAFPLDQKVRGLWVGPMVGDGSKLLFFVLYFALGINWRQQATEARLRSEVDDTEDGTSTDSGVADDNCDDLTS